MGSEPNLTITIDTRLYRLSAIQRVTHRYTGKFRVHIVPLGEHQVRVTLTAKGPLPVGTGSAPLLADFENELLDAELRASIGEETQPIRNLILAQAFSEANLIDPQGESGDPDTDPLHIRGARGDGE